MTTYFAYIFELKKDTPILKKKLELLLTKNFTKFTKGVRQSDDLKVYMKQGNKLVVE
jgi:hypothetical protein